MSRNSKNSLLQSPVEVDASTAWMTQLRQALFDGVNADDIKAITQGLVKKAKSGDLAATKLLLTYVCPQPSVHIGFRGNQQRQPEVIDAKPAAARQGTVEKLSVMQRRVANGMSPFHPEDGN